MAINLTATNHSLEIETSAAIQTQVVASFRDQSSSTVTTPGSNQQDITTATTTTVVAAPGASVQRQIDDVEVAVIGSGSLTVKAKKDVGGTEFIMFQALMGTGDRAHFTSEMGWRVFDIFGREKDTVGFAQLSNSTLLSAGAYVPPLGTTALYVECWGAGAGGGGAPTVASGAAVGGGGSSGGYAAKLYITGIPASITPTYGAGGGGGANTGGTGTNGGATSVVIGGVTVTAQGGNGGTGTTPAAITPIITLGGNAPAVGTGGDFNAYGEAGESGTRINGTVAVAGNGGTPAFAVGAGGRGSNAQGVGAAGTGFAAGGAGGACINGGGAVVGGAGTGGCVRFTPLTG